MLSILDNLGSSINEFADSVKEFFINNGSSPFLWVGIIMAALIIFEFVYNALRDK